MEQLVIHGGNPLRGRVKIGGAKNAVLPIIAAALLGSRGVTVLEDVPALEDVYTICAVLQSLGVRAEYEAAHHRLHIDATKIATVSAPYELVRKMRASFLIMGPLLAREGRGARRSLCPAAVRSGRVPSICISRDLRLWVPRLRSRRGRSMRAHRMD